MDDDEEIGFGYLLVGLLVSLLIGCSQKTHEL